MLKNPYLCIYCEDVGFYWSSIFLCMFIVDYFFIILHYITLLC